MNRLILGNCLKEMQRIPTGSIDMVLADLPYGTLNKQNKSSYWDQMLPLDKVWKEYKRVCKPHAAIVMFSQGMFTADLMHSNRAWWRYNLVWDKGRPSGFLNANRMPLRSHEDICVFYKHLPVYHPQMVKCSVDERVHGNNKRKTAVNQCYGEYVPAVTKVRDEKHPKSIIRFNKEHKQGKFYHPTQKPVELLEWLIRTYTDPSMMVLDPTCGSGSTGVAATLTGRDFIGIEVNKEYYDIAKVRIMSAEISSESSEEKQDDMALPVSKKEALHVVMATES